VGQAKRAHRFRPALAPELVDILEPRLVLIENVRGFTSDFKGARGNSIKNFAEALGGRLSQRYDIVTSIIRARDFGVPQVRPRFFLVGRHKSAGRPQQLDQFFSTLQKHAPTFLSVRGLPRSPSARDAISDLEVGRNGVIDCLDSEGFEAIAYPRGSVALPPFHQHAAEAFLLLGRQLEHRRLAPAPHGQQVGDDGTAVGDQIPVFVRYRSGAAQWFGAIRSGDRPTVLRAACFI
jgi:site-specific DNA-cytosine methylase